MLKMIILILCQVISRFIQPQIEATPETPCYEEPGQSLLSTDDYVRNTLAAGGWQCSCGRANFPYVTTCVCGMNKHRCASDLVQHRRERGRKKQDLEKKIRECYLLYESQFITLEEYEAMIAQLTGSGVK